MSRTKAQATTIAMKVIADWRFPLFWVAAIAAVTGLTSGEVTVFLVSATLGFFLVFITTVSVLSDKIIEKVEVQEPQEPLIWDGDNG